jgi:hypothetical protein
VVKKRDAKSAKVDVAARHKALVETAVDAVASRQKLNIRFSPDEIKRIRAAAERNEVRVMPLLKQWVLTCLEADEANAADKSGGKRKASSSIVAESVSEYSVRDHSQIHDALVNLTQALAASGYVQPSKTKKPRRA